MPQSSTLNEKMGRLFSELTDEKCQLSVRHELAERIFNGLYPLLINSIKKECRKFNIVGDDAEDIGSTVITKTFTYYKKYNYEPILKYKTIMGIKFNGIAFVLYKIKKQIKTERSDYIKRKIRGKQIDNIENVAAIDLPSYNENVCTNMDSKAVSEIILEATKGNIEELNSDHAKMFYDKVYNNMSNKEIAAKFKQDYGAVGGYISRFRDRLINYIQTNGTLKNVKQ